MGNDNAVLNKYYDIPYQRDGRSFDGCDCFGLFWLWYLHELDVCLPNYDNKRPDNHRFRHVSPFIESLHSHFTPISLADAGRHDVLYLNNDGDIHCGVVLDKYKFVHSLSRIGVAVSSIATWKNRIKGVYRNVD